MTKRDFFRLIFKLFGLYGLLITIFSYIPSNVGYVMYDFQISSLLWIFGAVLLAVALYVLFILKADYIIKFLKLEKGFDDDRIEFEKFDGLSIMKFALIIISLFMILDYLPNFLNYTYLYFKSEVSATGLNNLESMAFGSTFNYFSWVTAILNVVIGVILLANYARVSKWIYRATSSKNE